MAGNAPSEPPGLTQASSQGTPVSRKRQLAKVYSPSAKEQFPDVPWYDLDYQLITDMVHEMLDEIIDGQQRFAATDSGIKGVIDAAKEAKNLPDLEKCCMAVLGEQGAGKSTLVTALMGGRKLLEKSGNTKSCTAVPTVIAHKKGADDDTRQSESIFLKVRRQPNNQLPKSGTFDNADPLSAGSLLCTYFNLQRLPKPTDNCSDFECA
jgi:hypothetical protein